jgi:hypothetical protein
MRFFLIMGAALLASTAMANAEAFTFTSKGTITSQIMAPGPMGKPVGVAMSTFESATTMASGKKLTVKGTCGSWTAPPGGGVAVNAACQGSDETGAFSAFFACAPANDKNTVSNCWSEFTGTSGAYKGKTATASWRATQGADGKSNTAVGGGQWY